MPDIKPGDTVKFPVGEQTLILTPTPYGKLKKILKIVNEAVGETQKPDGTGALSIAVLFEKYLDDLIPLLFSDKVNPFLNKEWIDDNMTMPLMKEVMEAALAVNGVKDFFGRGAMAPAPVAVEATPQLEPTPAIP